LPTNRRRALSNSKYCRIPDGYRKAVYIAKLQKWYGKVHWQTTVVKASSHSKKAITRLSIAVKGRLKVYASLSNKLSDGLFYLFKPKRKKPKFLPFAFEVKF
jgi:hypothetical protein